MTPVTVCFDSRVAYLLVSTLAVPHVHSKLAVFAAVLWQIIAAHIDVHWNWVPAHSGEPWNEFVDVLNRVPSTPAHVRLPLWNPAASIVALDVNTIKLLYLCALPQRDVHAYPVVADGVLHFASGRDAALEFPSSVIVANLDDKPVLPPPVGVIVPCKLAIVMFNPCTLASAPDLTLMLDSLIDAKMGVGAFVETRVKRTFVHLVKTTSGKKVILVSSAASQRGLYGCMLAIAVSPWVKLDGRYICPTKERTHILVAKPRHLLVCSHSHCFQVFWLVVHGFHSANGSAAEVAASWKAIRVDVQRYVKPQDQLIVLTDANASAAPRTNAAAAHAVHFNDFLVALSLVDHTAQWDEGTRKPFHTYTSTSGAPCQLDYIASRGPSAAPPGVAWIVRSMHRTIVSPEYLDHNAIACNVTLRVMARQDSQSRRVLDYNRSKLKDGDVQVEVRRRLALLPLPPLALGLTSHYWYVMKQLKDTLVDVCGIDARDTDDKPWLSSFTLDLVRERRDLLNETRVTRNGILSNIKVCVFAALKNANDANYVHGPVDLRFAEMYDTGFIFGHVILSRALALKWYRLPALSKKIADYKRRDWAAFVAAKVDEVAVHAMAGLNVSTYHSMRWFKPRKPQMSSLVANSEGRIPLSKAEESQNIAQYVSNLTHADQISFSKCVDDSYRRAASSKVLRDAVPRASDAVVGILDTRAKLARDHSTKSHGPSLVVKELGAAAPFEVARLLDPLFMKVAIGLNPPVQSLDGDGVTLIKKPYWVSIRHEK